VVRIFRRNDAFSEILDLEKSPEEDQQLQLKDTKRGKTKDEKNIKN